MMVAQRDRDRRLDALADHLQHRHIRNQGDAEIAMQQLADPGEELGVAAARSRPSEVRMLLKLLRRRILAGQDRGGIARRQPQQQEHEQRNHAHHGNGGQHAAKQISEHRCSVTNVATAHSSRHSVCSPQVAYQFSKSRAIGGRT